MITLWQVDLLQIFWLIPQSSIVSTEDALNGQRSKQIHCTVPNTTSGIQLQCSAENLDNFTMSPSF